MKQHQRSCFNVSSWVRIDRIEAKVTSPIFTLPSFIRSFYHHSPFPVLIIISYVAREGSCANNKRYIHVCIFGSGPIPILELSTKPEILLRTSLHTEERDQKSPWRWLRKWNRFSAHIIGSRFDWAPL